MGSLEHEQTGSDVRLRERAANPAGAPDRLALFQPGASNALVSQYLARMPSRWEARAPSSGAAQGPPSPPQPQRTSRNVLAREWQLKPQKKGGRGISTANNAVKRRLLALVPKMKIVESGQMAKDPDDPTWRIDYQGPSHGPNGEPYYSMAAQVGGATYASCHCPDDSSLEFRQQGMTEAITRNDAIWWVVGEPVEEKVEVAPPKKGGGSGKGGGKGGGKKGQSGQGQGRRVKV